MVLINIDVMMIKLYGVIVVTISAAAFLWRIECKLNSSQQKIEPPPVRIVESF